MAAAQADSTWMWHPHFSEEEAYTAGRFVHFRKTLVISNAAQLPSNLRIHITADTRYKLYINHHFVCFGPVKGDSSLWFYDEIDIAPFLHVGHNHIGVHVLRFFHATSYASSFPRLPTGGLRVQTAEAGIPLASDIKSSEEWESAIDPFVKLRVDEPEDDFLHIYERSIAKADSNLQWIPAHLLVFQCSTGQSAPWSLSPRFIPPQRVDKAAFSALHNVQSSLAHEIWEAALVGASSERGRDAIDQSFKLILPVGTTHQIDIEVANHMTAFVRLRFKRPKTGGSLVMLTYAESYEDDPVLIPYLRQKQHRQDYSKQLFGPKDIYELQGIQDYKKLGYDAQEDTNEILVPFHFRTFRFIRLNIEVKGSPLHFENFSIESVTYPLDVTAQISIPSDANAKPLWDTSIRTLNNCMHDCYEDCPFYEQLQYAMDTRSSILFTYLASGDDRLARQAIIQLRNSFQARVGLTASRAPSHGLQFIPHFSLYWISMVCDHWLYFGDRGFAASFLPIIDAVLEYFEARVDKELQLVMCDSRTGIWNFHDWAEEWRPYGIPPSVVEMGISSYTNNLYAYTLRNAAALLHEMGRSALAKEYIARAESVVQAVRQHCFDGQYFTDSVHSTSQVAGQHSQLNQAWAVLSGAATGSLAKAILKQPLDTDTSTKMVPASMSMCFYVLRALSVAGDDMYESHFHALWEPWRVQLALGMTTWQEDSVSQRSDCHAWGSAPIYEFLAEVAGVRPAQPGWAAIEFKPRINLYPDLQATIPLRMIDGQVRGLAHVSWAPTSENDVKVFLKVELTDAVAIPVYVKLPSKVLQIAESGQDLTFIVPGNKPTIASENPSKL